ncbi:unnamed protein product [Fraxinus pennsylvanica]|uniref:Myb/SANT-like domain-containing protein n=1 Tax=Fraxinus pennsylvanica TaxID=56036 RepID=A0AAD1ZKL3_9LAMI|nr:unnamed protein product [Fraxinus pennsylvanica]
MEPNAKTRNVRWSDEMDGFLITSFVEQVLAGHKRSDNGFTTFQVSKAVDRVLNGCGVMVSDKNFWVGSRNWRIIADVVTWEDFITGNPDFGKWRTKLCPRYDEMETILGNDAATGDQAYAKAFKNHSNIMAVLERSSNPSKAGEINDDSVLGARETERRIRNRIRDKIGICW